MMIHEITKAVGKHPSRTRRGRGVGSGRGKTCGRGHKGAGARAGSGGRILAEGGAKPFYRRLPKRGFNNARHTLRYELVHLEQLNVFDDGSTVDPQAFYQAGLTSKPSSLVKILADGQLSKKLTVVANKFSAPAAKAITDAGGQTQIIS
jgi:large subunit ribosomal protein L15